MFPDDTLQDGEDGTLPGAYALQLVELVSRWHVTPEALLEGSGTTLERLADPSTRITFAQASYLIARAHRLTGEPALAVLLGRQMRLSWHGFLGFALLAAGNAREAITLAERFAKIRSSAVSLRLHVSGETASLVIDVRIADPELQVFVVTFLMVGITVIAGDVTGTAVEGIAEVTFPDRGQVRWERLGLPGRVRFSQPANRLVFPTKYLDLPFAMPDPVASRLAREQCERELSALGASGGTEVRVRHLLDRSPKGALSVEDAARQLGVSARTLKRQLAAVGTTFTEVVDEWRRTQALMLLDRPELTLEAVAEELGYSDLPNFTRAFKRWTGKTPAAFRRR